MVPGLGRCPGEGSGRPVRYSCLENSMDRGAWGYSSWGRKATDTAKSRWKVGQGLGMRPSGMTEWPHLLRQVSLQGEGTHSEERPWGREGSEASAGPGAPAAPEPGGDKDQTPSHSLQEGPALPTPHFQTRASRTTEGYIPAIPSHLLCGQSSHGTGKQRPHAQMHLSTGREEGSPRARGPVSPASLCSLPTQSSPNAARPGPAGCAAVSWVPQRCQAAGGVTCPGSRLGRCVSPRAPRPRCLREQTPPRSWTLPTSLPSPQGTHPQDRGGLGPGLQLSHREAGGPAERSPVIPLSAQGGEVFLGGCPCSLPACSSEGLPLMARAPAGPESVPPTFLGGTQSSRCFHGRTRGLLSAEAGTGVLLRTRESLRDTDSESGSSWSDL